MFAKIVDRLRGETAREKDLRQMLESTTRAIHRLRENLKYYQKELDRLGYIIHRQQLLLGKRRRRYARMHRRLAELNRMIREGDTQALAAEQCRLEALYRPKEIPAHVG